MQAAGWTECSSPGTPPSDYLVTPGQLTLITDWDNQTSTAVCWDKVPVGVSNWSASTRVAWTGNNVAGTIHITVTTTTHAYTWDANDMFKRYMLWRDGIAIWTGPLYIGQLGVWHDLRIDFVSGAIHLYLDELPMQTVSVQDIGTNMTGIVLQSQSGTNNSFAYVKANAVDPNAPDFTLIAGPTSQNISVGQNATFTVSLASVNGFSGLVTLAASVSPGGSNSLSVALSPSISLGPGGSVSANLTVATFQVISASTFNIRVNATSGSLYHAIQVSATVTAPPQGQNITINAIPGSLILQQGPLGQWTTHNITITIRGTTGFTGTIALSVSVSAIGPSPNGAITPSELLITGNKTYTATLYFPQGGSSTETFTVTASTAGLSTATNVQVDFVPSYFYTQIRPSGNIYLPFGSSITVSLNLISQNGDAGNVTLSYRSLYALPANPPVFQFPSIVTLTPNATLSVPVTISTNSNTPVGSYIFFIRTDGGWWTGDIQINLYVLARSYTSGVGIGTTATYSVSLSSYPGLPISVNVLVTSVIGSVISYTESFYVDNVLANSTSASVNILNGSHNGTVFVPFPFVAAGLQRGDLLFPGAPYGSISITDTSTSSLAGENRLTFSAGTGITINPVQFSATWDSATGILGILDGTVPINSTSVTAHYLLASTNAWTHISVDFTESPSIAAQFSMITFTPAVTGGLPPYTYHWDFGDGQSSNQPSPSHSYALPGSYKVVLTVTDKSGVVKTQTSTIKVSSLIIPLPFLSNLVPNHGLFMIGLIAFAAYVAGGITATALVIRNEQNKQRRLAQTSPLNN